MGVDRDLNTGLLRQDDEADGHYENDPHINPGGVGQGKGNIEQLEDRSNLIFLTTTENNFKYRVSPPGQLWENAEQLEEVKQQRMQNRN